MWRWCTPNWPTSTLASEIKRALVYKQWVGFNGRPQITLSPRPAGVPVDARPGRNKKFLFANCVARAPKNAPAAANTSRYLRVHTRSGDRRTFNCHNWKTDECLLKQPPSNSRVVQMIFQQFLVKHFDNVSLKNLARKLRWPRRDF